jgi:hypothetical protein
MRVAPGDPRSASTRGARADLNPSGQADRNARIVEHAGRVPQIARPAVRSGAETYSGWNSARMLPSGSLNHADLPTPVVVATWLTVLRVSKS